MAQDPLRFLLRAGLAAALALIAGGGPARGGPPAARGAEPELTGYVETLEVRLVLLQATVLNRRGEVVRDLKPSDFRLEENGVAQTITAFGTSEDQPLQVAFLLDVSGSMGVRDKLDRARLAIHRFVSRLHPDDHVALLIFADGDVVVKKGLTRDRAEFFEVLRSLDAWGQTALRDALAAAPSILAGAGPGRQAIVMLTDGVDNASTMTVFEAIRTARETPVPVYVLALSDVSAERRKVKRDKEAGRTFFEVLSEFGEETGGDMIPVFQDGELDDAVAFVEERLRAQYIIGYRPTSDPTTPGFREIKLATRDERLNVLTRTGYYAAR